MKTEFCPTCGSPVSQQRMGRPKQYCSRRCAPNRSAATRTTPRLVVVRTCDYCDEPFQASGAQAAEGQGQQRFCSSKCRIDWRSDSQRVGPKQCRTCSTEFVPAGSQVYCSPLCRPVQQSKQSPTARGLSSGHGKTSWRSKAAAWIKDHPHCAFCGSAEDLTCDHIYPRSKGGTDDEWNLQTLCRSCNGRKGSLEWFRPRLVAA